MSADDKEELERTRARLKELLRRVPASVCNGSYDYTKKYKKLAISAQKELAKRSPKLITLQTVCNDISAFGN